MAPSASAELRPDYETTNPYSAAANQQAITCVTGSSILEEKTPQGAFFLSAQLKPANAVHIHKLSTIMCSSGRQTWDWMMWRREVLPLRWLSLFFFSLFPGTGGLYNLFRLHGNYSWPPTPTLPAHSPVPPTWLLTRSTTAPYLVWLESRKGWWERERERERKPCSCRLISSKTVESIPFNSLTND